MKLNTIFARVAPVGEEQEYRRAIIGVAALMLAILAYGKDKSNTYQLGTYTTASAVGDGTTTNNISCGDPTFGSTVGSGGVQDNKVTLYRIQTADGFWTLETMRQASDAQYRRLFNENDVHFHAEKENPLDLLKNGDKVLFRVEAHKKLIGTEYDVFIPRASDPNKDVKYVGTFFPAVVPTQPKPPSDNVRAMCDAHKLSPKLEKQLCGSTTAATSQPSTADAGISQVITNSDAAKSSRHRQRYWRTSATRKPPRSWPYLSKAARRLVVPW